MVDTETAVLSSRQMAHILEIPYATLDVWSRKYHGLEPSVVLAEGRGSARYFNLEDAVVLMIFRNMQGINTPTRQIYDVRKYVKRIRNNGNFRLLVMHSLTEAKRPFFHFATIIPEELGDYIKSIPELAANTFYVVDVPKMVRLCRMKIQTMPDINTRKKSAPRKAQHEEDHHHADV